MHTRPVSTAAPAIATRFVVAPFIAGLATVALLGACSGSVGAGSNAGTTMSPSGQTTHTVTVTVTATPSATSPLPTVSRPGKPDTTMSTPPPAKDRLVIPDNPKDYGQAFVTAWVDRDRARGARLGTANAVSTAFGSTAGTAPAFKVCEGTAGSSYCTWQGDEYTMIVRILNERSAQRQGQAVIEVRFGH